MPNSPNAALHQTHTATNGVLTIYAYALDGWPAGEDPQTAALLDLQRRDIGKTIDDLARRSQS